MPPRGQLFLALDGYDYTYGNKRPGLAPGKSMSWWLQKEEILALKPGERREAPDKVQVEMACHRGDDEWAFLIAADVVEGPDDI